MRYQIIDPETQEVVHELDDTNSCSAYEFGDLCGGCDSCQLRQALHSGFALKEIPMIDKFDGQYRFLSNFHVLFSPIEDELGLKYNSVEAAYQASKTLDIDERRVFTVLGADKAKKLGKKIKMRPDWDEVKLSVMEDLLRKKFTNDQLREKLLATGDVELIEGNWWGDRFWGVCKGEGENHLGKLLMKIRGELHT